VEAALIPQGLALTTAVSVEAALIPQGLALTRIAVSVEAALIPLGLAVTTAASVEAALIPRRLGRPWFVLPVPLVPMWLVPLPVQSARRAPTRLAPQLSARSAVPARTAREAALPAAPACLARTPPCQALRIALLARWAPSPRPTHRAPPVQQVHTHPSQEPLYALHARQAPTRMGAPFATRASWAGTRQAWGLPQALHACRARLGPTPPPRPPAAVLVIQEPTGRKWAPARAMPALQAHTRLRWESPCRGNAVMAISPGCIAIPQATTTLRCPLCLVQLSMKAHMIMPKPTLRSGARCV